MILISWDGFEFHHYFSHVSVEGGFNSSVICNDVSEEVFKTRWWVMGTGIGAHKHGELVLWVTEYAELGWQKQSHHILFSAKLHIPSVNSWQIIPIVVVNTIKPHGWDFWKDASFIWFSCESSCKWFTVPLCNIWRKVEKGSSFLYTRYSQNRKVWLFCYVVENQTMLSHNKWYTIVKCG